MNKMTKYFANFLKPNVEKSKRLIVYPATLPGSKLVATDVKTVAKRLLHSCVEYSIFSLPTVSEPESWSLKKLN